MTLQTPPLIRWGVLTATLFAAAVIVYFPLFDYDVYWHLANGREMLAQGRIINEEVFSFTQAGTPFSNHEWLSQIVWFLVYETWGGTGLVVLKVFAALLVALLLYRSCQIMGAPSTLAGLITVTTILAGIYRYNVRPELFSLLFLALLGYLLHGYRAGMLPARALYFIPLVMLLWDWLHGAIFGVVLLGAFCAAENTKRWAGLRFTGIAGLQALPQSRLRSLNFALLLSLVIMMVNPYGITSYGIFFEFIGGNPLAEIVDEFAPPQFAIHPVFFVFATVTTALIVTQWRRLDLTHAAIILPFTWLGFRYSRCTAIYAIVAAPILANILVTALLPALSRFNIRNIMGRMLFTAWLLAASSYAVYIKFYAQDWQLMFSGETDDELLPAGAVRFVKEVNLQGPLYNTGNFGGYLSFFITPQRKIFQYNHHTVFGDTTRFVRQPSALAPWEINYAIVQYGDEHTTLFPDHLWATVFNERGAAVVLRRTPENSDLIEKYEVRFFKFHQVSDESLRRLANHPRAYARLMQEMSLYLSYRNDSHSAGLFAELIATPQGASLGAQRQGLVAMAMRENADSLNRLSLP